MIQRKLIRTLCVLLFAVSMADKAYPDSQYVDFRDGERITLDTSGGLKVEFEAKSSGAESIDKLHCEIYVSVRKETKKIYDYSYTILVYDRRNNVLNNNCTGSGSISGRSARTLNTRATVQFIQPIKLSQVSRIRIGYTERER